MRRLKVKIIVVCWLLSLMLLLTDNLLQAFIALCCFALFSHLMKKNKAEVDELVERMDKRFEGLINK